MTRPPADRPDEGRADDVVFTAGQRRKAEREERRQAKDAAYELRQQRRKAKDGTSWRGHNIVNTRGLGEAFPEPESPELSTATVRRRITHGVVLVLLLALVVSGVVLAGMVQRGELELKIGAGRPEPTPITCPAQTLDYPENKTVTVNVYNASTVEGRAGQAADELKKRGFVVNEVANKPTEYSAPAIIVSGPGGLAGAFGLQKNLPNTEFVEDKRTDSTVDVILTGTFNGFLAEHRVDHTPGALSCPRLSPPPSAPASSAPAPGGPPASAPAVP